LREPGSRRRLRFDRRMSLRRQTAYVSSRPVPARRGTHRVDFLIDLVIIIRVTSDDSRLAAVRPRNMHGRAPCARRRVSVSARISAWSARSVDLARTPSPAGRASRCAGWRLRRLVRRTCASRSGRGCAGGAHAGVATRQLRPWRRAGSTSRCRPPRRPHVGGATTTRIAGPGAAFTVCRLQRGARRVAHHGLRLLEGDEVGRVVRRVLVGEQPPELGAQRGVTQGDLAEQSRGLVAVLAAAPVAEAESADGVGGSNAGQVDTPRACM
jgi:hypothetical protein